MFFQHHQTLLRKVLEELTTPTFAQFSELTAYDFTVALKSTYYRHHVIERAITTVLRNGSHAQEVLSVFSNFNVSLFDALHDRQTDPLTADSMLAALRFTLPEHQTVLYWAVANPGKLGRSFASFARDAYKWNFDTLPSGTRTHYKDVAGRLYTQP